MHSPGSTLPFTLIFNSCRTNCNCSPSYLLPILFGYRFSKNSSKLSSDTGTTVLVVGDSHVCTCFKFFCLHSKLQTSSSVASQIYSPYFPQTTHTGSLESGHLCWKLNFFTSLVPLSLPFSSSFVRFDEDEGFGCLADKPGN